ncbi:hypothetical protein V9T40_004779 [Parthenolecanium corni]|uniref:Uncharacterized protein n=1 Tax=Parthenolecanium corni TaxID=536013 RepID=A0AAN9Y226_9HEMI
MGRAHDDAVYRHAVMAERGLITIIKLQPPISRPQLGPRTGPSECGVVLPAAVAAAQAQAQRSGPYRRGATGVPLPPQPHCVMYEDGRFDVNQRPRKRNK